MTYKQLLDARLGTATEITLTQEELDGIASGLRAARRRLRFPGPNVDLKQGRLTPNLRRAVLFCVELLRRRPTLAKAAGITAAELDALRQCEAQTEVLARVALKILRAAQLGAVQLTAELAAANQDVARAMQEVLDDPAAPADQQKIVAANLELIAGSEEQRAAKAKGKRARGDKKQQHFAEQKQSADAEVVLREAQAGARAKAPALPAAPKKTKKKK